MSATLDFDRIERYANHEETRTDKIKFDIECLRLMICNADQYKLHSIRFDENPFDEDEIFVSKEPLILLNLQFIWVSATDKKEYKYTVATIDAARERLAELEGLLWDNAPSNT